MTYSALYPSELAKADVLIISLRTLQAEFHLANKFPAGAQPVQATSLRGSNGNGTGTGKSTVAGFNKNSNNKDYFCPPWLCLDFSLLIIDETQKIESLTSSVASMCNRITARFRVSVSATPLANNRLADINPLFRFLRVKPFDQDQAAWKQAFEQKKGQMRLRGREQLAWLRKALFPLIIRRTKKAVLGELDLPPKEEVVRMLDLSAFEQELYRENRDITVKGTEKLASTLGNGDGDGDGDVGLNLIGQLQSLRKLCCHPQVWSTSLQNGAGGARNGAPLPFTHIMCVKVEEMRTRAEDAQRQLLYVFCYTIALPSFLVDVSLSFIRLWLPACILRHHMA
jgi:hypothetical protein